TIQDVGGSCASATSPMSVDDGWWLASPGGPVSATRVPSFPAAVATSLDGTPMATPADVTAPLPRGDGRTPTGQLTAPRGSDGPPRQATAAGTPASTTAGPCTVKVPINDACGSSATASGTAKVAAAGIPAPGGGAAADPLDPLAPSWVLDAALASLGG